MSTFAKQYAESLAQVSGQMTLIADRDQFIAAAGGCKALLGKSISKALEEAIENRDNILAGKSERNFIQVADEGEPEYTNEAISPIICEGDVIGAVILLNKTQRERWEKSSRSLFCRQRAF